VRAPSAYEEWGTNPNECSGNWPTTVYIEDQIKLPEHLEPGEYVSTAQHSVLLYCTAQRSAVYPTIGVVQ
jgi:hypothetical protein